MKELAGLSLKMREQRVLILKDNEEHLAEQGKDQEEIDDDEVEDDANEENKAQDEDSAEENTILKKIKDYRDKHEDGKDEEEEDDESDSDYEYTGGDLAIYDSALDEVDELLFIKDTLEKINQADSAYLNNIMSAMNQEELAKFNENMQNAQALKDREEVVRKQLDEVIDKKFN